MLELRKIIIILLLILFLVLFGCENSKNLYNNGLQISENTEQVIENTEQLAENNIEQIETDIEQEKEVIDEEVRTEKISKGNISVIKNIFTKKEDYIEVYRIDELTKEETKILTLDRTNYYYEIINDHFYVLRKVGYNGYKDDNWSVELWRYDLDGKGEKIFTGKYYRCFFLVSPNEEYIAIETGNTLIFLNYYGEILKEYNIDQFNVNNKEILLDYAMPLIKWTDDSKYLWGEINLGMVIEESFFKINTETWEVKQYIGDIYIEKEYDVNLNIEMVVYSDFPVTHELEEYEDFINSNEQVYLYLYNFNTKENKVIAVSNAKEFNPKWVDDKYIEYDNPDGDGRIIFSIE